MLTDLTTGKLLVTQHDEITVTVAAGTQFRIILELLPICSYLLIPRFKNHQNKFQVPTLPS